MNRNVAILGASANPERYAYKALRSLEDHGYTPYPVNPSGCMIDARQCYRSLGEIPSTIDTLTIYVRPEISTALKDEILALSPRRVVMNPGTENDELAEALEAKGILVARACTLVLLGTNQF